MSLSQRQLEVLRGLLNGKSNEQIAKSLGTTLSTVKNHVHSINRYLGICEQERLTLEKLLSGRKEKAKKARA